MLLEAFTPPTRGLYDPLLPLSPQLKQSSHSYLPSPPLTGLSPSHRNDRDEKISENELEEEILYNQRMESMHIASKGLLILIKLLGKNHLKVCLVFSVFVVHFNSLGISGINCLPIMPSCLICSCCNFSSFSRNFELNFVI